MKFVNKIDKKLDFFTIRNIFIIGICVILLMFIGTELISKLFINQIENDIKKELKQKVDMAYNTITPIIQLNREGKITVDEARSMISDIVQNMTYEDTYTNNYIFMSTFDGYYLVQPFEPNSVGMYMWDYQDIKGKYVIRELSYAAQQNSKDPYVRYYNPIPTDGTIEEKLAYVKGIPEIEAYIGTGTYLDLANRNIYYLLNLQKLILITLSVIISILLIIYLFKLKKMNSLLNLELERRIIAEKQLEKERDNEILQKTRLYTLFNNSHDAIVEFDVNGKILNVNKSFEKIFKFSKEECLGGYVDKLIVCSEDYNEAKALTDKVVNEELVNIETIRYTKDKIKVNVILKSIFIKINNKVLGGYCIYTDISDLKKYQQKLELISIYDSLTGLYSLNYFNRMKNFYNKGFNGSYAVFMCDLNGLKFVNDTLGHQFGDKLLKNFGDILKKSLRSEDIIARIGGDEFSVILPNVDKGKVKNLLNKIYSNIDKYNDSVDNKFLKLSVAIGYSISSNKNRKIEEVIKKADDLMYRNKLMNKSSSKNQILTLLMATLAEKDYVTSGHTKRVVDMCEKIAEKIGLDEDRKNKLLLLAEVHDLGKIAIPDNILKKTDKLSKDEWEIMKTHTEKGYRIALNSYELSSIAELILKHHERWDGKGYPIGLGKKDIPLECRILAIADSYDAMTNSRPYNNVKTHEAAIEEIKRSSGTQFDPKLVDIFTKIILQPSNV